MRDKVKRLTTASLDLLHCHKKTYLHSLQFVSLVYFVQSPLLAPDLGTIETFIGPSLVREPQRVLHAVLQSVAVGTPLRLHSFMDSPGLFSTDSVRPVGSSVFGPSSG